MKRFKKTVDATVDGAVDRTTTRMTDKVKTHFRENKKVYLAFAGGVLLVYVANGRRDGDSYSQRVIGKSGDMTITNNKIEVQMTRPGPKSYVVQCLENQATYPSLRAAARENGVSHGLLSGHLKGDIPDVNGKHYEKVAEI